MDISIVTPVLNRSKTIQDAIESVLNQGYSTFEHIVVDGGSTDGTLEIINHFPHLKVVSEPDSGMYDALNKGLRMAQGGVLGFLNSDDVYAAGVFERVSKGFNENTKIDAIVGRARIFETITAGKPNIIGDYPAVLDGDLLFQITSHAPVFNAWFFRKTRLKSTDGFNRSYPIAADRELLIRMAREGLCYLPLNQVVYLYRRHNDSQTIRPDVRIEEPYELENLTLCLDILKDQSLTAEQRRVLMNWHGNITARLFLRNLASLRWRRADEFYRMGTTSNKFWARFIYPALISALSYRLSPILGKHYG